LEVAGYVPALNGYVAGGIQVQEALVLQGTGNVTADDPTHDFSNHANLVQVFTNVSDDNIWNGPITLANTNEIQKVTVTGLGGTYALTFSDGTTSATTAALPVNATDAQVQAALNALSNVGAAGGSVTVSRTGTAEVQRVNVTGTSGTFTLTFNGQTTPALAFN